MTDFDYVKVYLYAYPKLEMMAEAVSSGAQVKAFLSFRDSGSAFDLAEKIAWDLFSAQQLRMLKRELDEALSRCTEQERFLLEYKYFRRKSELCGRFACFAVVDCSERNYFRRQNAILRKIAALLLVLGRSERNFYESFGAYPPFLKVLNAIKKGKERTVVAHRKRRGISFCVQNSASCGAGAGLFPRRTNTAITAAANPAAQMSAICRTESPSFGGSFSSAEPETSVR